MPFMLRGLDEDSPVSGCGGTLSEVDVEAEDVAVKALARRLRGSGDWRGDARRPDEKT